MALIVRVDRINETRSYLAVCIIWISVLPQEIKSILDFDSFALQLLYSSHMSSMLIFRCIFLNVARFLQFCQILVKNASTLANFIIHALKIISL